MRIAICPGSFDPVTKGHLNIIERSAKLFDAVTVLVMVNPNKTPSFTAQERADFRGCVTGHIPNVKVDVYTGRWPNMLTMSALAPSSRACAP